MCERAKLAPVDRIERLFTLHRAIGAGTLVDGTTGMSRSGKTVYRGTATGCLAEHVVVSGRVALPTNGAVPLQEAALLGCAALTGVGAVLFAAGVEPTPPLPRETTFVIAPSRGETVAVKPQG